MLVVHDLNVLVKRIGTIIVKNNCGIIVYYCRYFNINGQNISVRNNTNMECFSGPMFSKDAMINFVELELITDHSIAY